MFESSDSNRPVRVRFAPSPTGYLHIGGVRAALFNWLYARHHQGQFLLRIEDTDQDRSEERFTRDILDSMKWLGLTWDEEPIYQSQRLEIYRQEAEALIERGHAYRCYCTEAEVEIMREKATQLGQKPRYDRRCRSRKEPLPGAPFVIRARLPLDGFIGFHDMIRGDIRFDNNDLDDFVLIRSNGAPTYNLSVVVDDVHQRMTHIMRGDDHINNTPKQIHLYHFFNYPIPLFAHLPMILGADKKKLSKRHGAVSANAYRDEGYLPEALLNFLARLGWSHGDQEVFTVQEMIDLFSFDHVQKSSGIFNTEKLLWLNGAHIRLATPDRLLQVIQQDYSSCFSPESLARAVTPLGREIVKLIQPKVKLMKEMAEQLAPLCTPGVVPFQAQGLKWDKDPALKAATKTAVQYLRQDLGKKIAAVHPIRREGGDELWGESPSLGSIGLSHVEIDLYLRKIGEEHGVKLGDFAQPIRLVVTGRLVSAGLFELLSLLPWDVLDSRLDKIEGL